MLNGLIVKEADSRRGWLLVKCEESIGVIFVKLNASTQLGVSTLLSSKLQTHAKACKGNASKARLLRDIEVVACLSRSSDMLG